VCFNKFINYGDEIDRRCNIFDQLLIGCQEFNIMVFFSAFDSFLGALIFDKGVHYRN
jgi:hypothetical protein